MVRLQPATLSVSKNILLKDLIGIFYKCVLSTPSCILYEFPFYFNFGHDFIIPNTQDLDSKHFPESPILFSTRISITVISNIWMQEYLISCMFSNSLFSLIVRTKPLVSQTLNSTFSVRLFSEQKHLNSACVCTTTLLKCYLIQQIFFLQCWQKFLCGFFLKYEYTWIYLGLFWCSFSTKSSSSNKKQRELIITH